MLGQPEHTILKLADQVPIVPIGVTRDGVVPNSASRCGDTPGDPLARMQDTFERFVLGGSAAGFANHELVSSLRQK